jgi:hypothetical protein
MKKSGLRLWIIASLLALCLTGCSSTEINESPIHGKDHTTHSLSTKAPLKKTIPTKHSDSIKENIVSKIAYEVNGNEHHFTYEVKNHIDHDVTLPFNTSERFDYIVRDQKGKKITQFSDDKMYSMSLGEEVIKPSKSLKHKAIVNGLVKGTYEIEMWLTTSGKEKLKQTQVFKAK